MYMDLKPHENNNKPLYTSIISIINCNCKLEVGPKAFIFGGTAKGTVTHDTLTKIFVQSTSMKVNECKLLASLWCKFFRNFIDLNLKIGCVWYSLRYIDYENVKIPK